MMLNRQSGSSRTGTNTAPLWPSENDRILLANAAERAAEGDPRPHLLCRPALSSPARRRQKAVRPLPQPIRQQMSHARARTIMERKWTAALASGGGGGTFALDGRLEAGRHWVPQPRPTDRPALFPGIILCRRRSRRARAAVSDFARSAAAITLTHDRWWRWTLSLNAVPVWTCTRPVSFAAS